MIKALIGLCILNILLRLFLVSSHIINKNLTWYNVLEDAFIVTVFAYTIMVYI